VTDRPTRVVDAHVHLWDPARTDWYPYLSHPRAPDTADVSRMYRPFDVDTYRTEAAGWNVEKFVNVAAATGGYSIEETLELDEEAPARGGPDAVIGGIPPTDTVAEAVELLDRQMRATRFRGVRPMGRYEGPLPEPGVLRALQERDLVFELMTHPDQLRVAADGLAGFDDLVVVVEHTGRDPTRSGRSGARGSTHWPSSVPTWCASSPDWRCRSRPSASTRSRPGSGTPSRCSASTAACSPATSRWIPCTAPSTSSMRCSAK